ncbi:hypothetical protein EDD11_005469 [Mortierella claussenii]|nr:hypothetical protein EDD11_005469 [Mortierella claussenii]
MSQVAQMVAPTFMEAPHMNNVNTTSIKASITKTTTATLTTAVTRETSVKVKTLSLKDFHNTKTRTEFLRQMRESLMEIGTFYIKDHGISSDIIANAMKTVQEYFALPLEEKKKMLIANSRHFRGYKLMGEEFTNNQVDHREQLQFGPEQSAIETFKPAISPDFEGLQGPNQWPTSTLALLPHFQPCILDFMTQLETLSQILMEAVALSLGLSGSYFRDLFCESPYYRLKCAKYPSVNKAATIGCGAHKDTGFLTVLLQDMVGGLQGQDPKTGVWMDTKPIPDTFIVTMGEAVEKMTKGLYHATVHRVLNNTSGQDRYSIPFFFDPALHARIPHEIEDLETSAKIDFENKKEDEGTGGLIHGLGITAVEDSMLSTQEPEGWSSGAHVFETVHRCHPEVYSRWYNREC